MQATTRTFTSRYDLCVLFRFHVIKVQVRYRFQTYEKYYTGLPEKVQYINGLAEIKL